MAQGYTDFGEYSTGAVLYETEDWTFANNGQGDLDQPYLKIEDVAGSISGKVVKFDTILASGHRNDVFTWNQSPDATDFELFFITRHRRSDAHNTGGVVRFSAGTGYAGSTRNNSTDERIWIPSGDTGFTSLGVSGHGIDKTQWHCQRFQVIGDQLKLKTWQPANLSNPTADEPVNWGIELTNTSVTAAGKAGIIHRNSRDGAWVEFAAFSFGTNGDPAPTEPVGGDTTVNPTTSSSTSAAANPAVAAGASVKATAASSTSEAPSPTATTGASSAPTAAQSTSTAIDPAISSGASASPTVALSNSNALEPQVTTDQSVLVEPTVTGSASVSPDPLVSAGATIKPTAAESVSAANDPVLGVGVAVQPTDADSVSAPLTPTVTSGASVSPATGYSESAANDPLVSTAANVFPFTARSTGKSLDPLVSGGLDRYVVKKTINGVYYRELSIRGEYPRGAEIQGIFPRRLTLR